MREIKEELVTISAELDHDMTDNPALGYQVRSAYSRFKRLDWGDTHPADKPAKRSSARNWSKDYS